MATALGSRKVAKYRDITKPNRWFDLHTTQGWDRAKKAAKEREELFTHFHPPWQALSRRAIAADRFGDGHPKVIAQNRSQEYLQELKVVIRCFSLCGIKHAIGDFFAIQVMWPNPVVEAPCYRELVSHPGVDRVTTDERTADGWHRRLLITNVPWLATLTRDSEVAMKEPTLSWNWKVAKVTPNLTLSQATTLKYAASFTNFLRAPKEHLCPFCAEGAGNPGGIEIPDGPPPPPPTPE